jgi:predicted lipoprotein with Yx(FWY)xxD motif
MKKLSMLLVAGLLVLAGCGDDESTQPESAGATATTSGATTTAKPKPKPAPARTGTAITVGDSDYGEMLFDSKKQAIYIFQNDPKGKSVCYGECAAAWPPVLTDGQPRAVRGMGES